MNNDEFYQDKTGEGASYDGEELMPQKNTRRGWSVAAFILSIFSVLCCCLPSLSVALGVISVIFLILSRKSLGYFDGFSIAALIMGVFGIVFGVSTMIVLSNPAIKSIMEEILKESQQ